MIGLSAQLQNGLGRAAREIATDWDASIQKNFQSGGRPKWPASRRGGAILQKSGRLAQSITVRAEQVSDTKYAITARTNNIVYARIHQYGGTIRAKTKAFLAIPLPAAGNKRPRDFGDKLQLRRSPGGHENQAVLGIVKNKGKKNEEFVPLFVLKKSVAIVARPYIVIQPQDSVIFKQHLSEGLREGNT